MAGDLARAAELAMEAIEGLNTDGRPLAAANVALDWPEEPHLALWQAATVLREHHGDGHVTALVAAGLDGRQALVTMAATGAVPPVCCRRPGVGTTSSGTRPPPP